MAGLDPMASARPASGRRVTRRRPVDVAVLAVLAAAAAYEAAVALGWLEVGPEPGQAPPGDGLMLAAAVFALVVGACLCVAYAVRPRLPADALASLLAPAAAAFVVARFYTFDPYYAPTLRRISDDGLVADAWVYTLVGLAVLAGALVRIRPRLGLSATAFVLMLSAVTALAAGLGH
jgi:hypothetical protein